MKTVLILGGTGAMGKYLVDILAKDSSWEVFVTSRSAREDCGSVKYIKGNARDREFMSGLFANARFDVIVDFMNYGYDEFSLCHKELLSHTDHYVFLSSCRVYDDCAEPIREDAPRLLDTTADLAFLQTQRYALRKARQENMLKTSGFSNYTIVRPYITYSDGRLQLGVYEKEDWLYRVLNDKPLVIRAEILDRATTLTWGNDVARVLARVAGSKPLNGAVHITSEETLTWRSILKLYSEVIKAETGKDAEIYTAHGQAMEAVEALFEGGYNTKYDRLFDRSFNNSLAETLYGHVDYLDMDSGLRSCLKAFINEWKQCGNSAFLPCTPDFETLMDELLRSNENGQTEERLVDRLALS
ncbi:MAG: NAD(P)H-binding protein [Clostridia bacterium]|nr:NAD(P)H-binding protein [Clostridia bacterium]